MIEVAAATAVVGLASSIVTLADKIWDSWKKYRETGVVTQPNGIDHGETIRATPGNTALVHTSYGHTARQITREELAKVLSEDDYDYLRALEKQGSTWLVSG
jgi:hypothetical protein